MNWFELALFLFDLGVSVYGKSVTEEFAVSGHIWSLLTCCTQRCVFSRGTVHTFNVYTCCICVHTFNVYTCCICVVHTHVVYVYTRCVCVHTLCTSAHMLCMCASNVKSWLLVLLS